MHFWQLHVGLTGGHPDFADQDVGEGFFLAAFFADDEFGSNFRKEAFPFRFDEDRSRSFKKSSLAIFARPMSGEASATTTSGRDAESLTSRERLELAGKFLSRVVDHIDVGCLEPIEKFLDRLSGQLRG